MIMKIVQAESLNQEAPSEIPVQKGWFTGAVQMGIK